MFYNPVNVLDVGESWDLWNTGLPVNARDTIRKELIDAFTEQSEEKGFKFTYFTVITVGKK